MNRLWTIGLLLLTAAALAGCPSGPPRSSCVSRSPTADEWTERRERRQDELQALKLAALLKEGVRYLAEGKYEKAEASASAALRIDPGNSYAERIFSDARRGQYLTTTRGALEPIFPRPGRCPRCGR